MANYQLMLGDCLDKMSLIEDGSVDCIICDLPYQVTACKWDVMIPFEPLWTHYKRVIKRNGAVVLFGREPFSSLLRLSNLGWYKYDWVWIKNNATNAANSHYRPMTAHENILVFSEGRSVYNPQMTQRTDAELKRLSHKSVFTRGSTVYGGLGGKSNNRYDNKIKYPFTTLKFNCVHNRDRNKTSHPTQKPVALLEYLIKTYTNEGKLVLDNCFGSCSTGEAALRTGRRFIGIEKDSAYYQIGVDRMERIAAELRGESIPKIAKGELQDLPMFQEVAS